MPLGQRDCSAAVEERETAPREDAGRGTERSAVEDRATAPRNDAGGAKPIARAEFWIPLVYVLASVAWFPVAEVLLARIFSRGDAHWPLSTGLGFVTVTALALHVGLRWTLGREREAYEALHQANERKSNFIAMLSHELRNPLAPLRHALWVLDRAAPGTERAARARGTLRRQLLHLTRITDDLLDVTRISHGRIQLQRTKVDLVEIVRLTVEDHAPLFAARQVSLAAELPPLPLWVEADPTRIGQVVGNVLRNAAKFTDPGGRARVAVEREPRGSARVSVRDDGIGIPPKLLAHVFDPFVQADTSLDRTRGGLGLGLSVVKGLVEFHGGSVEARSEGTGRGSEFTIRLPLAPEQPALACGTIAARETMPRHRVLVVEDNIDAAETLREMLLMWDHEVEVAHDGREGVAKARWFQPDVVLCDIGLPVMDGYEVARALRSDPELSSAFLVAVTGYASPEDARKAVGAGFDRHVGKPMPVEVLEEVLATVPAPSSVVH
jgi:signal transduction histidine kinase/CheY-like chemotaxis protein